MKYARQFMIVVSFLAVLSYRPVALHAQVDHAIVPQYVLNGLAEYGSRGYEAAVHAWLTDSPYKNAMTMASNIAFFKNIEKLAGKYISYDILMTKQTISSNVVYVRMNYERLPGFILFTSLKRGDKWVLGKVHLDRLQRFGSATP